MGLGLLLQRRRYAAVWSPYRLDPYDTSGNGSTIINGGVYGTPYGKGQPAEPYGHQASGTRGGAGAAVYDSVSTSGGTQVWAPGNGGRSAEFPGVVTSTQSAAHGPPPGIAAAHESGGSPVHPAPASAGDLPPAPATASVYAAATAMAESCLAKFHGTTTAPMLPYPPPPPPQYLPPLSPAAAASSALPPAAIQRSTAALLGAEEGGPGPGPSLGAERNNRASGTQGRGRGAGAAGGGSANGGRRNLSFADSLVLPPVGFDALTDSASDSGDGGSSGEESSSGSCSEQEQERKEDGEGGVPGGGGDLEAGVQGAAGAPVEAATTTGGATAVWRRHTSGNAAAAAVPGGDDGGARRSLTLMAPLAAGAARGFHPGAPGSPEPASVRSITPAAAPSPPPHPPGSGRRRRELNQPLRHSSSSNGQQHRHLVASLSKEQQQQQLNRLEFSHVTVTVPWSTRHQQRHLQHHHPHDEVPPAALLVPPEPFPEAPTAPSAVRPAADEAALPHAQSVTTSGTRSVGPLLMSPQPALYPRSAAETQGSKGAAGGWWKCGGCLGPPWGSGGGQQAGREQRRRQQRPCRAILNDVSGRCLLLLASVHTHCEVQDAHGRGRLSCTNCMTYIYARHLLTSMRFT